MDHRRRSSAHRRDHSHGRAGRVRRSASQSHGDARAHAVSAAVWGQRLTLPVAATVLVFATQRLGPAPALAACIGLAALIGVVMQPMVATTVVMFLVYL